MITYLTSTSAAKLKEAYLEFFSRASWANPYAVTLTLRWLPQHIDGVWMYGTETDYVQNLKHFLKKLNFSMFGHAATRYGKRTNVIPVLEQTINRRWHHHLMLDRPNHIDHPRFMSLIDDHWRTTRWGFHQTFITPNADAGWIRYIAKVRSKATYSDAFDAVNLHISTAAA